MTGLPMDDPRYDALTGVDEDVIEVARALASARREVPAELVRVRWAAVAASEAATTSASAPAAGTPAERSRAGRRVEPRTAAARRRGWGLEGGWAPRLAAAMVAVAVVAALWAWLAPLLTPTAVKERREPRGHVPSGPAVGEWTIVDQLGGPTRAIAHEGRLLLAGRGRHLEAYDLSDTDVQGRPRLLAVSALLPGLPTNIDIAGDRAIVAFRGVNVLWVFDLQTAGGIIGWFDHTVKLTRWQELATRVPVTFARIERIGAFETIYGIEAPNSNANQLQIWQRRAVRGARFAPVGGPWPLHAVGDAWSVYDAWSMDVYRRQLFIGHNGGGVTVLDVSDPAAGPTPLDDLHGVSSAGAIEVVGKRLYVAAEAGPRGEEGVAVFDLSPSTDVSKRATPRRLGFVDLGLGINSGVNIAFAVSGHRMAVAFEPPDASSKESLRIEVVDIRDMGRPRVLQQLDVEGTSTGVVLEGEQLVLTRFDGWIGPSLDVIDLGAGDSIRLGVPRPLLIPPFRPPLLASPAIESVIPWQGGTLLQSNLDVVGARLEEFPSLQPDGNHARASFGVDALTAALGLTAGWRVPKGMSSHRSVVAQVASGNRAAAILLRDGREGPEFGLLTWTADDDPASWPSTVEALDRRVAWAPLDRLLDLGADASNAAYDHENWQLALGTRYAVASFGLRMSRKIAVYDLVAPAASPNIVNAANAIPSGFPEKDRSASGFTVRDDLLYAFDVGNGMTQRLMPGGTLEPLSQWWPRPYGAIECVVATERGLLIVRREDVQLWPYDATGNPDASRVRMIGTAAEIHPAEARSMSVALDGDRAYIAGITTTSRTAFVREIDLAAGRLGPLAEFPVDLAGASAVAFADNRLFLYNPSMGISVLERRPRGLRGDMAPSATRDAPRGPVTGPH